MLNNNEDRECLQVWINCTKTQDPRVVCEASLAKLYCDY